MLDGIISGLLVAWVLSWFNIHNMLIDVLQPYINLDLTINHYYVAFLVIGMIGGLLHR